MRIVLDPGHGGRDPGAIGPTGLTEAEVVLDIAQRTRRLLTVDGHECLMTRCTDEYVSLETRADFANQLHADLYMSIHCNAFTNPESHGTETWYYDGSEQGKVLAVSMQEELVRRLGLWNRGIKPTTTLSVLRRTKMPAVLLELAFISNPEEEAMLRLDGVRTLAAVAIYDAVSEYERQ